MHQSDSCLRHCLSTLYCISYYQLLCCTVLHCIAPALPPYAVFHSINCCIAQYCTVICCIVLHLYCTVLYCISYYQLLCYTVLHLYFTALQIVLLLHCITNCCVAQYCIEFNCISLPCTLYFTLLKLAMHCISPI